MTDQTRAVAAAFADFRRDSDLFGEGAGGVIEPVERDARGQLGELLSDVLVAD